MTNMDGVLPNDRFGHAEVEAKVIMRTSTARQQRDGGDNVFHTPESKDQCFVDRFGQNEARVPNSRPIISPMVSAIMDELTETAASILAEDDAGLALLDSQIEEARNLNSGFKGMVRPRLLDFRSDEAVGAVNSKDSLLCTNCPSYERSPSCHDLNGSGCAEEVTKEVNLGSSHFAPSFEGGDGNPLRRRDSEVANLRHRHNASARLDFGSESLTGDRRISQEREPLHTTKDLLPFATPERQKRALQLVNSSNPHRISHECNRSKSSEIRSSIPITEDSEFDIFSGLVDVQHEDEGLIRSNSRGSSEGKTLNKPRRWWDIKRFLLLPLASREWRNICWYGGILLGGTVCVVLALPLAAALAKALASPPDYLMPT